MIPHQHGLKDKDLRVLERVKRAPTGASAIDIARAALGSKAKRHSAEGLTMIGLGIAARLCGAGLIAPTRSNRFVARLNVGVEVSTVRGSVATCAIFDEIAVYRRRRTL